MPTHSPSSRRAEECWKLPELHMQHQLYPSKEERTEKIKVTLHWVISPQPSSATSLEFKFPCLPAKRYLLPLVKQKQTPNTPKPRTHRQPKAMLLIINGPARTNMSTVSANGYGTLLKLGNEVYIISIALEIIHQQLVSHP